MSKQFEAVVIPKWGIEMTHGKIVEWRFAEGQAMNAGDELVDIETDKIVNSYEARVSGTLARIVVDEGEELPVGALIGVVALGDYGSTDIDTFVAQYTPETAVDGAGSSDPNADAGAAAGAPTKSAEAAKISPALARKLGKAGIDPAGVVGTGPGGRIVKEDVDRAIAAAGDDAAAAAATGSPAPGSPLSAAQSRVAASLVTAQSSVPLYHVQRDVPLGDALARLKAQLPESRGLVNLLVVQAVGKALAAHPELNLSFDGKHMTPIGSANVGIAVARDDGAVAAPVVRVAQDQSAGELGALIADLVDRARSGRLVQEDNAPAAITVSNLGMYGVSRFTAMVTPPQILVLSLGAVQTVPHWDGARFVPVEQISLTLGCDHRLVNGAQGAEFLAAVAEAMVA